MKTTQYDNLTCKSLADLLTDYLHGSGWDDKWQVSRFKNGKFFAYIGYHAMDEYGGYDGWFEINATIAPGLSDCKVTFTSSPYHRRRYISGQESYYTDSVWYALAEIKKHLDAGKENAG